MNTNANMVNADIQLEREGHVARLRLNRPTKGNSLSADMVRSISLALEACEADGTKALLIEGEGRHFCTGFDLSDLDAETDDSLLSRFVRVELMLQKVHQSPVLTAAWVHGKAWGAGADLFAACTLRWADSGATFAFPGAGFGLVLGTGRLAALTGGATASEWVMTGRTINAEQALRHGLVQMQAPDSTPLLEMLHTISSRMDPATLRSLRAASAPRSTEADAADLARLVESAARPGLRDRIAAYREAQRSK